MRIHTISLCHSSLCHTIDSLSVIIFPNQTLETDLLVATLNGCELSYHEAVTKQALHHICEDLFVVDGPYATSCHVNLTTHSRRSHHVQPPKNTQCAFVMHACVCVARGKGTEGFQWQHIIIQKETETEQWNTSTSEKKNSIGVNDKCRPQRAVFESLKFLLWNVY